MSAVVKVGRSHLIFLSIDLEFLTFYSVNILAGLKFFFFFFALNIQLFITVMRCVDPALVP